MGRLAQAPNGSSFESLRSIQMSCPLCAPRMHLQGIPSRRPAPSLACCRRCHGKGRDVGLSGMCLNRWPAPNGTASAARAPSSIHTMRSSRAASISGGACTNKNTAGLCEKTGGAYPALLACHACTSARTPAANSSSAWRWRRLAAVVPNPPACTCMHNHRPQPGLQRPVPGRWLKRGSSS